MEWRRLLLLCVILYSSNVKCATKTSGKTAAKVGLTGMASKTASSESQPYTPESDDNNKVLNSTTNGKIKNILHQLKNDLLYSQGYDKALRPVKDPATFVKVTVDFTTRQILDLDEKSQILKIYVHYRLYWTDEFLQWDPEKYQQIKNIWLAATSVWRPDVVVYEDVGSNGYSPNLPYVEVSYDGTIRYLEPIVFETSCSVNIKYFPFDYQVCTLTFTPWTFPTSKVDVISRRLAPEMESDIQSFLQDAGEWKLDQIEITKMSMLFPSILLTTIALLGFYLPPDSGERIGLQITILLTFMVFLLTVGEMFPASSTGPYLGVYFVICMGLLAINLSMTVLVLHMHYMPVCAVIEDARGLNGELILKKPPAFMRAVLSLARLTITSRFWNAKKYPPCSLLNIEGRKEKNKIKTEEKNGVNTKIMTKYKNTIANNNKQQNTIQNFEKTSETENSDKNSRTDTLHDYSSVSPLTEALTVGQKVLSENIVSLKQVDENKRRKDLSTEKCLLFKNINKNLLKVIKLMEGENDDLNERNKLSEIEDEWRAMARIVDDICLKIYIALLVICHIAIIIQVFI